MTSNLPPDMAQLELSDDNTISRLEALPQELRKEILRYVLHTRYARLGRHVRQTEGDNVTRTKAFDWTIGVLRACKTLHSDGIEILNKQNKWIKIVLRMDRNFARKSLLNHDVHFVEQGLISTPNNDIASIQIASQRPHWVGEWGSSTVRILIPIEEIQAFCWYLRAMDLPNFIAYKYKFEVKLKLSKSLQRQVLQPFASITGEAIAQQIEFTGPVDGVLKNKLTSAMTQNVGWLRAKAWDIYHCTEHIKSEGDEAFLKGEFNVAMHKYRQVFSFWDCSVKNHSMVKHIDNTLDATFKHLDMACVVNLQLAEIMAGNVELCAKKEKYESTKTLDSMLEIFKSVSATPPFAALAMFIAGILMLVNKKPRFAEHAFQLAHSVGAASEKIQSQRGLIIAKTYGMSSAVDRKADIEELIFVLPREPLASPPLEPYICEYAALEKHLCRQLGFSGTFPVEATNLMIEGVSIRSVIYCGIERMSSETQVGLGVRFTSKVLKQFLTEGRGSYSQSDIDILEMLLTKRLAEEWRLSGRQGRKPALSQVGPVRDGHPQMLNEYKRQYRITKEYFRQKGAAAVEPKMWPKIDNDNVPFHTLKEEQYEELVHLWDSFTTARKTKLERVVQEMYQKYHRK